MEVHHVPFVPHPHPLAEVGPNHFLDQPEDQQHGTPWQLPPLPGAGRDDGPRCRRGHSRLTVFVPTMAFTDTSGVDLVR